MIVGVARADLSVVRRVGERRVGRTSGTVIIFEAVVLADTRAVLRIERVQKVVVAVAAA